MFEVRCHSIYALVRLDGYESELRSSGLPAPLTTVRQDVRELGRSHVAALIDAIGRVREPDALAIPRAATRPVAGPLLVVGQSAAPASDRLG